MTRTISTLAELETALGDGFDADAVDYRTIVIELLQGIQETVATANAFVGLGLLPADHPGVESIRHVFADQLTIVFRGLGVDVTPLVGSMLNGGEDEVGTVAAPA